MAIWEFSDFKNVSSVCAKLGRLPPANQVPYTSPNHIERLGLGTLVGSMADCPHKLPRVQRKKPLKGTAQIRYVVVPF